MTWKNSGRPAPRRDKKMPKLKRPVTSDERIETRKELVEALDRGDIELGPAIRRMRLEWTGLNQGRFGRIVGLSANTVSAIERDADNSTMKTLKRILKIFGMTLTIRPEKASVVVSDSDAENSTDRHS